MEQLTTDYQESCVLSEGASFTYLPPEYYESVNRDWVSSLVLSPSTPKSGAWDPSL